MSSKSANLKNEKQYEALKARAAKIADSPGASKRGGHKRGSDGDAPQRGTAGRHKAAACKAATQRRARRSAQANRSLSRSCDET